MVILGIILALIGLLAGISPLWIVGLVLIVVGAILLLTGAGGRRFY